MTDVISLFQLSDEQLKQEYLNYSPSKAAWLQLLPEITVKDQVIRVVKLALEVDLRLGAKLAGIVKPEFQRETLRLITMLDVPQLVKIKLLAAAGSDLVVPTLLQVLNTQNTDLQSWAAWALAQIGSQATVEKLIAILNHQVADVRKWAIWTLGQICIQSHNPLVVNAALSGLITGLNHQDAEVRWRAVTALGQIKSDQVVAQLLFALNDHDDYVRGRALGALGQMGKEELVPILWRSLQEQNSYIRSKAATALAKITSENAISTLLQGLNEPDTNLRWHIVWVLEQIGSAAVIPGLLQALHDQDAHVRSRASEALAKIGTPEAIEALVSAVKDADFYVRWRVISVLGQFPSAHVVAALNLALEDGSVAVRQKASEVLHQIHTKAELKPLETENVINKAAIKGLPKIVITSCAEASEEILCPIRGKAIKYLISIGSPGVSPPQGFTQVNHRLRLEFDDIETPDNDPEYVFATLEHITRVIDFVSLIAQDPGNVLIHCQAGISRSAAVALTVCAQLLGAGRESEAIAYVMAVRPQAKPNKWVVELADIALGRRGKLLQALS